MNDIFKSNIKEKLINALEKEKISTAEAGRILGINPLYLTMMKNENTWPKCAKSAWDCVSVWINSGQKLVEYSEKHGKVLPENKVEIIKGNLSDVKIFNKELTHKEIIKETDCKINKCETQKVVIDIEINLIINGKHIELK